MPEETRQYAEVILPLPLYGTFTYSIPRNLTDKIGIGYRIIVPFGRKNIIPPLWYRSRQWLREVLRSRI